MVLILKHGAPVQAQAQSRSQARAERDPSQYSGLLFRNSGILKKPQVPFNGLLERGYKAI